VAAGAAVAALAVVLFFVLRPEPAPEAPPPVVAAPPAPVPVPTQPPVSTASASSATTVNVRINTDPDGADVRENGVELCSSTPCDIPYEGAESDPAKEHKLTVTRAGYRTEIRAIRVGDSPVIIRMAKLVDAGH
jgi:hypothetical protein